MEIGNVQSYAVNMKFVKVVVLFVRFITDTVLDLLTQQSTLLILRNKKKKNLKSKVNRLFK